MWHNVLTDAARAPGPHCPTPCPDCSITPAPNCDILTRIRAVPTPVRASYGTPQVTVMTPGPTLLEQAVSDANGYPFFLASTLLETLQEFFFPVSDAAAKDIGFSQQADVEQPTVDESNSDSVIRQTVLLETSVPTSHFQQQCLQLESILDFTTTGQDWLDNDLRPLLEDTQVPLKWRTHFVNIRKWHEEGEPSPHAIHIFTDGSAATLTTDVKPCSWAYTVWFDTPLGCHLYGFASESAAVPDTPYFLGEVEDTALVGEQLALAWGMVWVIEFAGFYGVPVTFHYDARGAGKGAFGEWTPPSRKRPDIPRIPSFVDSSCPPETLCRATSSAWSCVRRGPLRTNWQ